MVTIGGVVRSVLGRDFEEGDDRRLLYFLKMQERKENEKQTGQISLLKEQVKALEKQNRQLREQNRRLLNYREG